MRKVFVNSKEQITFAKTAFPFLNLKDTWRTGNVCNDIKLWLAFTSLEMTLNYIKPTLNVCNDIELELTHVSRLQWQ